MTFTTIPKAGHRTFLRSGPATDPDARDADFACLGTPHGDACTVADRTDMPAVMRQAAAASQMTCITAGQS